MEPLAGWTVGVTADRRAAEQTAMLERRGAAVLCGPVIRTHPLAPEAGLRASTDELVARPPDVLVASTGIGIRSWFASAWTWGSGEALPEALAGTRILARGPKAAAAIAGEGLRLHWRASDETLRSVLDHLLDGNVAGQRIAVQLAGQPEPWFTEALREAGAEVIEVTVYKWTLPENTSAAGRLVDALLASELDAVTFTSAHSVQNLLAVAGARANELRARLASGLVTVACVGPVTAGSALDAGAADTVVASPARLGAMVKALADRFASRARHLHLAGSEAVLQGTHLDVNGTEIRLTRRERLVFEALLDSPGTVLSKERLARVAWETDVDEHTVEVAVNRLRRKLGPAAAALETTSRRGYRVLTGRPSQRRLA